MNIEKSHTYTLEKIFGPIKGQIIRQDENIRVIRLTDNDDGLKTLAVVHFLNIHGNRLMEAHHKIVNGGLIGKTLYSFNLKFDKEFVGSLQVKLNDKIKSDFETQQDFGLLFFSKISMFDEEVSEDKFYYAEIIEIIPLEMREYFKDKMFPVLDLNRNLKSLLNEIELRECNIIKDD